MPISAPPEAWLPHVDLNGFDVSHGELNLSVRFCPGSVAAGQFCLDTLRGTERTAVPQIPFLSEFVTQEPPLSTLGLDLGANLVGDDLGLSSDLEAMLQPDRKYLIAHTVSSGLSAQIPGLDFLKLSTGGDPTTFVMGAEHPFFYYEGEFSFPFGEKKQSDDTQNDDGSSSTDDGSDQASNDPNTNPDASDPNATDPNADPNDPQDPQQQEPQAAEQDEEPESEPPVFAVALDSDGHIPFTPLRKVGVESYMTGFEGHLYVRGPVPISALVELDGTVVVDLDPDEDQDHPFEAAYYTSPDVELGGNGALTVALPFDFVDLSALGLELGDATATAKVSETEDRVVFTGVVTSEGFLAELPIPIPIRPDARVEAWGRVSGTDPLGSYAHLEGAMGVSLSGLGALLGLPLGDLAAADAMLDVSAAGVTLQGSTHSSVHPSIASGALALMVHVPTQGNGGFVQLQGDVVIAGQEVRDATIRIGADGMTVNGMLLTDQYSFAMVGSFAAAGYRLEGSTSVADPIALNAETRAVAALALEIQRAALAGLQADLAAHQATLAAIQSDLSAAQSAVAAAQAEVNRLQTLINSATSSRNSAWNSYLSWSRKSCAWYDAVCQATRAANMTYYLGRYTYYAGLVTTYSAAKTVATAALSAAQAVLAGIQTQVTALQNTVASVQSQVNATANGVALAQAALDQLPDVGGQISPVVTIILENGIASGRVDATWNGMPLGGGTVRLSDPAEACVEIPGAGPLCTPL
jgi:hypothetical protein